MANDDDRRESDSNDENPSELDQYKLEGYKDLSRWNNRDEQSMIALDRLFIPASVLACVLVLAGQTKDFAIDYLYVFLGSTVVLCVWLLLSFRCKARLAARFEQMHAIEKDLRFDAHSAIDWRKLKIKLNLPKKGRIELPTLQDMWIRVIFFLLFVLVLNPCVITWLRSLASQISNPSSS